MQRFLLSLLIILGSSSLFAQTIEEIEAQVGKGEFDKAKTSVDGFLAKEKNQSKADGWWYKGLIYNEIAKSDKYKRWHPMAVWTLLMLLKSIMKLDPKAIRATLEQHVRLFDIYNGYLTGSYKFWRGRCTFQAKKDAESQAKFSEAYTSFKNALMVEEFVSAKAMSIMDLSSLLSILL
jgi:hypothetical protein